MSAYQVQVTGRAKQELREASAWIAADAPETAERWVHGFWTAIESLSTFPRRCSLAGEHARFPYELRQLLYGRSRSYRAIFTIQEDVVTVLAIRHAKQADLTLEDV